MITHLEVLLEEPSMEVVIRTVFPRIIPGVGFDTHPFRGKPDLLKKLEARLAGYSKWLTDEMGVVVIVDRDHDDCRDLKHLLESTAHRVGLRTASNAVDGKYTVLNRIAVEELEAWFFGDIPALRAAYDGVPASLAAKAEFRDPDAIRGGTAERLERVLQNAGHFRGGLLKTRAAREISAHMNADENRSRSFCELRDGLRRLVQQGQETY